MNSPIFHVVVNDEEQYSIWAGDRPAPAGWHDAGVTGTKEECLAHIEQVWTDMRPRSLREAMGAAGGTSAESLSAGSVSAGSVSARGISARGSGVSS